MASRSSKNLPVQAYRLSLKGYTQREIGKKLNRSESRISEYLSELKEKDEYQLGVMTVVTFLEWFERAAQFFNMQNSEYQELIEQIENIKIDNSIKPEDKIKITIAKIEEIRRLKENQDKNMERIVYQAKEGQLIGAIQLMRDMLVSKAKKPPKMKLVKVDENVEERKIRTKTKR